MLSTASTVRRPGQPLRAPRVAASVLANTRRRTRRPCVSAAMRVVEGVALGPAGCANAEAVLVEVLDDSRVGQGVVALERQQVITTACQDLFGDRGLAPHGVQGHNAVLHCELVFTASWPSSSGTAVISFDLPSTQR